MMKSSRIR